MTDAIKKTTVVMSIRICQKEIPANMAKTPEVQNNFVQGVDRIRSVDQEPQDSVLTEKPDWEEPKNVLSVGQGVFRKMAKPITS